MKLILYTKLGCPWCDEVRFFLNENGIDFEEREVRSNDTYFKELLDKSGQTKTPTIDLNGEILADTDADEVEKFLVRHGVLSK